MQWRHLDLAPERWREGPEIVAAHHGPVAVSFGGPVTAMLIAACAGRWTGRVVPWLTVDSGYLASLAARDVGTLCSMLDISDVVISSNDDLVDEHAEILWALLAGDDVSLDNAAGTLVHAYNQPRPLVPPTIWVTRDRTSDLLLTLRVARAVSDREPLATIATSEIVALEKD